MLNFFTVLSIIAVVSVLVYIIVYIFFRAYVTVKTAKENIKEFNDETKLTERTNKTIIRVITGVKNGISVFLRECREHKFKKLASIIKGVPAFLIKVWKFLFKVARVVRNKIMSLLSKAFNFILAYFRTDFQKGFPKILRMFLGLIFISGTMLLTNDEINLPLPKNYEDVSSYRDIAYASIFFAYCILYAISFLYLFHKIVKWLMSGKKTFFKIYFSLVVLYTLFAILISLIETLFRATSKTSFSALIILTLFSIYLTYYTALEFIESSKRGIIHILSGLIAMVSINMYILLVFGLYNIKSAGIMSQINDSSFTRRLLRIVHYGAKSAYDLPDASNNGSLVPIGEFLVWNFYNLIVVGFLVAYFYQLIMEKRNLNNQSNSDENI